jgi:DNA-binding NarL/FixJ family response regulator
MNPKMHTQREFPISFLLDGSIIMKTKLVLIINTGTLLIDGVAGLLQSGSVGEYDVVNTLARNLDDARSDIRRLKPAVVVMEDTAPFISPSSIPMLLHHVGKVRLIVLSSHTKQASIYDKSDAQIHTEVLSVSSPDLFIEAFG